MQRWEQKIKECPLEQLLKIYLRIQRELTERKNTRLGNQSEAMLRSTAAEQEVRYLESLLLLPDTRE